MMPFLVRGRLFFLCHECLSPLSTSDLLASVLRVSDRPRRLDQSPRLGDLHSTPRPEPVFECFDCPTDTEPLEGMSSSNADVLGFD